MGSARAGSNPVGVAYSADGCLPILFFRSKRRVTVRAAIAQLGERQTEDLEVLGSIPGFGTFVGKERLFSSLEPCACERFMEISKS